MLRRPPRSTQSRSSAASDVYKRQVVLLSLILFVSATKSLRYPSMTSLDVTVGETMEIVLDANPSTGYRWELTSSLEKIKKPINKAYDEFRAEGSHIMGSAGKQVFTLEAQASGQEVLTFAYKRPWETKSDEEAARVTINIK
eukprot:TRINITY_DN5379_c0_g1_i15.p1 TRINITY_DN5379_c0_g1~~TRINITY_DN5379_c0_g1_i15.p1  ORF type:complete len:152 (-),score=35.55 TRINITY_DN5379_c0_g1_i15:107-532(-)